MRRLLPLLGLLAILATPATASATDEVAQSGSVKATFSYSCPEQLNCSDLRMRIARSGVTVFDQEVKVRGDERIGPGRPSEKSVLLRQLDSDPEPEVLLDVFTGGAHCCLISFVYDFQDGAYKQIGKRWNDPGYVLRNLDRKERPEFVSGDYRFAFLFTSFAESRFPIQIWRFEGRRFRAVTRSFRNAVRKDRDRQLRFYRTLRRERADVRGALAAYQADNYLLGRRTASRGWRVLRRLADQGKIKRPSFATGPSGRAYLRSLQRKLRRFGYTR
ncbi:MAG: hypothetical protein M3350_05945 [Actinomycetota bacterium]|nr:hypothetical protein [Actinomycetota bacterium]MDQ3720307.1 hypothetical protein [Actinomycetota bacterium]